MVHTHSSRVTEACSHHACPRREVCTLTRALQRCLPPRRIPSLEEKLDSFARRALELLLGCVVELVASQAASARVDARTRQTLASERDACGARRVGLMGGGYAARLWQRVEMVASRRVGKASAEASRRAEKRAWMHPEGCGGKEVRGMLEGRNGSANGRRKKGTRLGASEAACKRLRGDNGG